MMAGMVTVTRKVVMITMVVLRLSGDDDNDGDEVVAMTGRKLSS